MKRRYSKRLTMVLIAWTAALLSGCHDATSTSENKDQTQKRQAIIQKHKNDF